MPRSLSRETISTKQVAIAELARKAPQMVLTTLAHQIDAQWLQEAYRRTRKSAAAGVDGVTAEQYEANLTENLESLLDRLHTGTLSGAGGAPGTPAETAEARRARSGYRRWRTRSCSGRS